MFCHRLCFLNQNDYLWSKKRWFLAVDGSYFFLKTAVDGSFSNFHVTSKICLNWTSRYYIKTSVHSYFNIIKRSIILKCPTRKCLSILTTIDLTMSNLTLGKVSILGHKRLRDRWDPKKCANRLKPWFPALQWFLYDSLWIRKFRISSYNHMRLMQSKILAYNAHNVFVINVGNKAFYV